MANEIIVIGSKPLDEGSTEWSLWYYFDLAANPVTDADGEKVPVEQSFRIPAAIAKKVESARKSAIDAGDGGFLVRTIRQTPGESTSAFLSRVQADHAAIAVWWRDRRQAEVVNRGIKRDA